jgi:cytochrome P450
LRQLLFKELIYTQLNEDGEGSDEVADLSQLTLAMEATLAIIAGSHTTSTALAIAITYLVLNPKCIGRLREELDAAAAHTNPEESSVLEDSNEKFPYGTEIPSERLVELKYLQAVINESMRLQPAIPHGVERTPPMDGGPVVVAGK